MSTAHATSWPEVFHEQYEFVCQVVGRLAGPELDPDDLVQEVFVVVHRKLATLKDPNRLRSWIYGICRRVVSFERRKKKVRASLWSLWGNAPPGPETTPETELSDLEMERRLYTAIDRLTDKCREVLILFALEEMSGKEIAKLLEIPEATVWTRLHSARKQLLAKLRRCDDDAPTPLKETLQCSP